METENKDKLFIAADEVTNYLDDMMNVLASIVKGIEDSKDALLNKCEEHRENQKEKGDSNDGEQN